MVGGLVQCLLSYLVLTKENPFGYVNFSTGGCSNHKILLKSSIVNNTKRGQDHDLDISVVGQVGCGRAEPSAPILRALIKKEYVNMNQEYIQRKIRIHVCIKMHCENFWKKLVIY